MDISNKTFSLYFCGISGEQLKTTVEKHYGISPENFYVTLNGKRIQRETIIEHADISLLRIIPRVLGGKGGFGSMLRAIGAQIEKTTNREACRDLSGRRLRDINEETRLKNWINQQAEREKEAKERKQKKLEKLCQKPKHEFSDKEYDKERSELPEIVEDAVLQGLQASASSSSGIKRQNSEKQVTKKKKAKLWVDDEIDEEVSSEESEDEDAKPHTLDISEQKDSLTPQVQ